MPDIQQSERTQQLISAALQECQSQRHEFVTPEHLLFVLFDDATFYSTLSGYCDADNLCAQVDDRLQKMEHVPEDAEYRPQTSAQLNQLLNKACEQVYFSSAAMLDTPHLVMALLQLQDSWASYLLKKALGDDEQHFMSSLITAYEIDDMEYGESNEEAGKEAWRRLVTCMNDHVEERNPLIGREAELERTIQVLCRRDKNNPLHVGEPGVGKTALVWGLARRINSGNVPQRLKDSRIYQLDMGTLLAGTQYRGDFENRIKQIMDGISGEAENNIVYIDEIHTLVGAGAVGDSSMDASNMLKPYLETSHLRFIGSTTYEEYNKHFSRSKGLVRRFQQIDISEPTIDETKNILRQLRPKYEEFHKVIIEDAAIDFAVEASAKHVNDRYLPDKAIDLIDEAGAALEAAETNETYKPNIVTKPLIAEILSKTCKVDALAMKEDNTTLETLQQRMSANIYGQDEAVRQVVEAVQMSKAGLTDDNKPLASLLFVGPTGVGKTEVARVLAHELGI